LSDERAGSAHPHRSSREVSSVTTNFFFNGDATRVKFTMTRSSSW
jgi:hypothetical protein